MAKFNWAICSACEGHGKRLNRSIGEHCYSMEEFNEAFPDDYDGEFNPREEYFKRGGIYDVPCSECGGSGKVQVPNIAELTFAEKRELVEKRRQARWAAESEAERRAEMRMMGEY